MKKDNVFIAMIILVIIIVLAYTIIYVTKNGNNEPIIDEELYSYENNTVTNSVEDTNLLSATELVSTEGLSVLLTMNDKLDADSVWCGTFQLIWNDLKNELAKKDIVFTPQLDVVKNLNKEDFNTDMISEDYYYKKYGTMSLDLKAEIENAIKEKFNEKSDILDDFNWDRREDAYFLYAMLKREFEFLTEFQELENASFANNYEDVRYFGIKPNSSEEARAQIDVLYYNSPSDFAIIINTKQGDEVILCRNNKGTTFNEIYENINTVSSKYKGSKTLTSVDEFKMPNISFKEKKEFTELEKKPFKFANGDSYMIEQAMQTIQFDLDKKGGAIKSEAGMAVVKNAAPINQPEARQFNLDDTFTIFLREQGKEKPYFAARIEDISKFQ